MYVKCDRVKLLVLLAAVSNQVNKQSSLPILRDVLVKIDETGVEVTASNLESVLTVRGSDGFQVEAGGSFCVRHSVFFEVVNKMVGEDVVISMEPSSFELAVKCDDDDVRLKLDSPDDFPLVPTWNEPDLTVRVSAEWLVSAMSRVSFATASDDTRPILSGVSVVFSSDSIVLVATNGFHLAEFTPTLPDTYSFEGEPLRFIVPEPVIRLLNTAMKFEKGNVDWVFRLSGATGEKVAQFAVVGTYATLSSQVIEGVYVSYHQLKPAKSNGTVVVKTDRLLQAVELTGALLEDSKTVTMTFDRKHSRLRLASSSDVLGNGYSLVDAVSKGELPSQINLSMSLFMRALKNCGFDTVTLGLKSRIDPLAIRHSGEIGDWFYMLMPLSTLVDKAEAEKK